MTTQQEYINRVLTAVDQIHGLENRFGESDPELTKTLGNARQSLQAWLDSQSDAAVNDKFPLEYRTLLALAEASGVVKATSPGLSTKLWSLNKEWLARIAQHENTLTKKTT